MRILIVDDEKAQRNALTGFLKKQGHSVSSADSAQTALAYLYEHPADLVISDFKMPYMTGQDLLEEVRRRHPGIAVVLVTAFGTIERAVEAMKHGAWDFLSKPVDLDELELIIEKVAAHLEELNSSREMQVSGKQRTNFITQNASVRAMLQQAERVAASHASVLITGETGAGKEVLASYIHESSQRSGAGLVAVNCAALPSHLIESELFGHEKGAFTGATDIRIGRFEEADGATLFLDEIGDLPVDMQTKLLRFLQSGEYQRIGENTVRTADVRIIAATNVDLEHAIETGEFREDLFYRLNVVNFHLPPLRERNEDILILAQHFIEQYCGREGRTIMHLDPTAQASLKSYHFPGNIRELANMMERAVLLGQGDLILENDLNFRTKKNKLETGNLVDSVARMEAELISSTLDTTEGNQSECARRLGISERVLRYKLKKYGLK